MLAWINRRCKHATGLETLPFGGISVILCGDIAQLPPISDQVLYHNKPKNDLAVEGYCMYQKFQTVVKLQTNERTKGSNREQENFRQLPGDDRIVSHDAPRFMLYYHCVRDTL